MPEVLMNKVRCVGVGHYEMPADGRRYRFTVERWRHDDGTEFGRIISREEIPDIGPQLMIPSYGTGSADEAQYLRDEWEHEKTHPHPLDVEFWGQHRAEAMKRLEVYNELRDARAAHINRNPVTKGRT